MLNLHIYKLLLLSLLLLGSISAETLAQTQQASLSEADQLGLRNVEVIHGTAGPFAVAGYRMGARAMIELEMLKGSFALEVVHDAPPEVQWSCIVDGLQAATGASLGKLNLKLNTVKDQTAVRSIVIDRESGVKIIFRLQDSFLKRFLNVPVKDLSVAGREALSLKDEEIFTIEVVGEKPKRANPFKRNASRTTTPPTN